MPKPQHARVMNLSAPLTLFTLTPRRLTIFGGGFAGNGVKSFVGMTRGRSLGAVLRIDGVSLGAMMQIRRQRQR